MIATSTAATLLAVESITETEAAGDLYAALVGESDAFFQLTDLLTSALARGIFQFCTRGQWFTAMVSAPKDYPTETESMQAAIAIVQTITEEDARPFIEDVNIYSESDSAIISLRMDTFDAIIVVS